MTDKAELRQITLAKLRTHADLLKHNVATWQLLARAADEIERLVEALEQIAEGAWPPDDELSEIISDMRRTAKDALASS